MWWHTLEVYLSCVVTYLRGVPICVVTYLGGVPICVMTYLGGVPICVVTYLGGVPIVEGMFRHQVAEGGDGRPPHVSHLTQRHLDLVEQQSDQEVVLAELVRQRVVVLQVCNVNYVLVYFSARCFRSKGLFTRAVSLAVSVKKSPPKFIIVPMVTDHLTDRLGSEPILSISVNLTEARTETKTDSTC